MDLPTEPDLSLLELRRRLDAAFDVEAVTEEFFKHYKRVFADLQDRLTRTSRDKVWAHDYALQLLNRLMFLYFIQRKRWLGDDPNFIANFWRAYKSCRQPKDTFFDRWLSVLFFEAFNNKFQAGRHDRKHFPEPIRQALAQAPFLNGGLFAPNKLDEAYDPSLPDEFFATLFDRFDGSSPGFLERYNFTIAESTPLDIEVAVDPEMIGKVYESLVNITFEGLTEEDQRGSAGIFYTPRVEIDLMCRLSLVDALANHLGTDKKPLLYDAVFAYDPAEKERADHALAAQNLWPDLNRLLRETTVCDPACGSGSFLVGMLLVLDDLQARANAQLGIEETPYERRRRIIGEQLYGVDVMDWAVHVAELRLWLQRVVETELKPAELRFRPLLPNLSFKVRCGDSLVQEIGGINFGLHRAHLDIPAPLKGRITQLKGKKLRFYQGEPGLREADLKTEELAIFRDILTHKRIALQKTIVTLTRQIESPPEQTELAGIAPATARQERLNLEARWRAERDDKQAELRRIEQALDALRQTKTVPFVWDIAFVEIFAAGTRSTASALDGGTASTPSESGPGGTRPSAAWDCGTASTPSESGAGGTGPSIELSNGGTASTPSQSDLGRSGTRPSTELPNGGTPSAVPECNGGTASTPSPGPGGTGPSRNDTGGFDIVIGNPPYVRQEMIAPPTLDPADFGGETSDRWKEQKKTYKAKLQESVAAAWPRFFRYKPGSDTFRKTDGKSDLYIYFYLHGLSLLNPRGSFCFITSNSWLDVGYGADLQEFLLKHSHVKFILDNERKRSFAQADVNTIIALLAPPDDKREAGLDKIARFVMFKAPFEDVLDAETFKTLETAAERQSTDRWRICVRSQRELLEEGLVYDEEDDGETPSTPSVFHGGTRSTASEHHGGTPSTASGFHGGTPSTASGSHGGTRSTASALDGGTASTPSESGPGGTGPSTGAGRGGTRPSTELPNGGTASTPSASFGPGGTGPSMPSGVNRPAGTRPSTELPNGATASTPSDIPASALGRGGTRPSTPFASGKFATIHIKTARYEANKWGGKYLRTPEIFFTILEKGKGKLVRLGDIAEVRFGIKTGANEFFYLDDGKIRQWGIEKEFLQPVILRPAEIVTPIVRKEDLGFMMFSTDASRTELKGTRAEAYIRWGESQGFHQTATCRARGKDWYRLPPREPADLVIPIVNKMRLVTGINQAKAQVDHNLVELRTKHGFEAEVLAALSLGSFNFLLRHIEGRSYGRMIKVETYEAARLVVLDPRTLSPSAKRDLLAAFEPLKRCEIRWLTEDMKTPEREAFDRAWLAAHGFATDREQNRALAEIREAVEKLSAGMDAQEQDWVKLRDDVRTLSYPQDRLKGKRRSPKNDPT